MDTQRRSSLGFGLLLVLVGGFFLAAQFVPGLTDLIDFQNEWPWWVIGVGVLFLLMAVLLRAPGLAVPAAIIGGIGGILLYQNRTGDWESWAYMWALIPGFAGVGTLLMHFLEGKFMRGLREGIGAILFSFFMFGIFSGFLGGPRIFSQLWPLFLIGAGVWILLQNVRRPRKAAVEGETKEQSA